MCQEGQTSLFISLSLSKGLSLALLRATYDISGSDSSFVSTYGDKLFFLDQARAVNLYFNRIISYCFLPICSTLSCVNASLSLYLSDVYDI